MNRFPPLNNERMWISIALVILLIASLLPRFYGLGELSFQRDEEYTAFAARAVVEEGKAELPSGMSYLRALPLTYASAISAQIFGTNNEYSYRLPVAIIGTLSPVILFLLLRSFVGTATALIVAFMLAFSEWNILLSREARMYAPFFLLYTCTTLYLWRWVETDKRQYLLASILLFSISVMLHKLALIAAIAAIIPILINTKTAVTPVRAVVMVILFILPAFLYHNNFVSAAYETFKATESIAPPDNVVTQLYTQALNKIPIVNPILALILLVTGATVGYWLAISGGIRSSKLKIPLISTMAYYSLAIMTGIFTFTGLIYAAFLTMIVFFSIETGQSTASLKSIRLPLVTIVITTLFWICYSIWQYGLHDGIKSVSSFPFPYLAYFILIAPGLTFLFICSCIFLLLNKKHVSTGLRFSIIATIVPLFIIGLARDWGALRYLTVAYPFIIIAGSIALMTFLESIGKTTGWWNKRGTLILGIIITTSGLISGNGIPSSIYVAKLDYGEPDYWTGLKLPDHPDHQSAGLFVKKHLQTTDIVVAEDASMQRWYTGKVDYWLRNIKDARNYLYQADDGYLRDIYVSSRIVTEDVLQEFDTMASRNQRIWVITSRETYEDRTKFLSKEQQYWLKNIELTQEPIHIGRDKITKVYCLGCNNN